MRRVLITLTLFALVAGVANAATPVTPAPAQNVTATIAAAYSITVTPASVSFPNFQAGIASCQQESSTVVTITSSSTWSLTVEPDTSGIFLRNGGSIALTNPLQVKGGNVAVFTNLSTVPMSLLSGQAATASMAVPTAYQQCVTAGDAAGAYSLGVIYTLRP